MDPASVVGLTAASATLLKFLMCGSLDLKRCLHDIRAIDDTTDGLIAEVAAFHSILSEFDSALRDSQFIINVDRWWNHSQLDILLSNAANTFSQLDSIVKDIARHRSMMQNLRQYYRS